MGNWRYNTTYRSEFTQFITIVEAHLVVVDFFIYLIYWLFTETEGGLSIILYIFYLQNLDFWWHVGYESMIPAFLWG